MSSHWSVYSSPHKFTGRQPPLCYHYCHHHCRCHHYYCQHHRLATRRPPACSTWCPREDLILSQTARSCHHPICHYPTCHHPICHRHRCQFNLSSLQMSSSYVDVTIMVFIFITTIPIWSFNGNFHCRLAAKALFHSQWTVCQLLTEGLLRSLSR